MRLLGFKSLIIFLVIIFIASCKSNLEKIPLSDIQSHRNYQDSIYKLDLVPINQLKRLKSLINEYKLHESEWSKDPNYSYYLLRLYGRIDNLPFKGFLYDTINKRLNYRQDYINFYDSVLFYGSKALTDNSSNIYSLFILANSMYYNTERSILTNNSDVPSYLKSKPVVYNNMAMHIMNNCHLYKQFDTTKNKYLIRGIYEIALFFLNNSSRFKSNYSYSASDDKKTNALYKYGEFYDFLKEFSDYAVIKWDYSYIKRNILPNIKLARNDIDQRNKEFLAKKAEEEFNLVKVDHKYSYCDPENGVFAMLDLYGSDSYTQSGTMGTFTISGRGTYSRKGHKISFFRTSGVAFNGDAIIRSVGDKIEIILPKGVRYIEDDDLYYIKNSISTKSETDNQQIVSPDFKTSTNIEGIYINRISKIMGGLQISQKSELEIIRDKNDRYLYNLKVTVVDEYDGGIPRTEISSGYIENKDNKICRFFGGTYGERGAYISLSGQHSTAIRTITVLFVSNRGNPMIFERYSY